MFAVVVGRGIGASAIRTDDFPVIVLRPGIIRQSLIDDRLLTGSGEMENTDGETDKEADHHTGDTGKDEETFCPGGFKPGWVGNVMVIDACTMDQKEKAAGEKCQAADDHDDADDLMIATDFIGFVLAGESVVIELITASVTIGMVVMHGMCCMMHVMVCRMVMVVH